MHTGRKTLVCLDLMSNRDSVNRSIDVLSEAFNSLGLPEELLFDIKLAAQEAVANAVEHGNHYDQHKAIHVTCTVDEDALTITVRDEGEGFDPSAVPDPTLPENILKESGRGIFLMRRLCDEVRFNTRGNEVTLVKRLRRPCA